jgi:hypothetical protein
LDILEHLNLKKLTNRSAEITGRKISKKVRLFLPIDEPKQEFWGPEMVHFQATLSLGKCLTHL